MRSPHLFAAAIVTALPVLAGCAGRHVHHVSTATLQPEATIMISPRGFIFRDIEAQGRTYRYAVYVPRDLPLDALAPLVVFLHGRGECGEEGSRHLAQGLPLQIMATPEAWPMIVLMPQKPDGDSQWDAHDEAVTAMLDRTLAELPIDPDRVYLTGLSQGGYGTWYLGAKHADRFAAIAPVCGYINAPLRRGDPAGITADIPEAKALAASLHDMPTWIFHGDADDVVPPQHSTAMHGALKAAGNEARLSMYPGVNHGSWGPAYREAELPGWLLSHRRSQR